MPSKKEKPSLARLRELRARLCEGKTDWECSKSIILEQLQELNALICDDSIERCLLNDKLSEILCLFSASKASKTRGA